MRPLYILQLPDTSPFLSWMMIPTDSDTPNTPSSPTHDTPFTEITASTQRSPIIPRRRVAFLVIWTAIPYGRYSSSEASSVFSLDASSDPSSRHHSYQEGVVEVTYETLGDLVQRIVGVESTVIALTERLVELEWDNMRLRGTASVDVLALLEILPSSYIVVLSGRCLTHDMERLLTVWSLRHGRTRKWYMEDMEWKELENGGNGGNINGHKNGEYGLNMEVMPVARDDNIQGNVIAANPARLQDAYKQADRSREKYLWTECGQRADTLGTRKDGICWATTLLQ
ncbi:hypothetical protein Tco_0078937 [Tanacetum coccineum]